MTDKLNSIDDVMRALKKIDTSVNEILELHRLTQEQMVKAALTLTIGPVPGGANSPRIRDGGEDSKINDKALRALRSKYTVVQELFHKKTELEAMEAKLRVNFGNQTPQKAIREIERLQKQVLAGISEAFNFLSTLANEHMPRKLELLHKAILSSLQKSVLYKKGISYSYVFEVEGDICFAYYIHLTGLEDENGKRFPEIFFTMTQRLGAEPQTYVGLQHHFTPPSEDLMMKRVKSVKEALRAYAAMLELDHFENTLGSLPLELLLNPKSITKNIFSYAAKIESLDIDEHSITFNLRRSAKLDIDEIASQLFKELNVIQRRTNARLRMSVERADPPKVYFKFVPQQDAPPVSADDLEFLKLRFGVDQEALARIAKIINVG